MNSTIVNGKTEGVSEAEATLRLIAGLPAPVGLAERVKAGLAAAEAAPARARVLKWPAKPSRGKGGWVQGAAAAALLLAIAGGGRSAYKWVAPVPAVQTLPAAARPAMQGGFSAAGAMRRPETLAGPIVPVVAAANSAKKDTKAAQTKHGKKAAKAGPKAKYPLATE
ncbi:MAG: hypothetical protein P4L03_06135 [Terracidiphilus sp.]|nr:hypothetical protein [Terracidiphilus sp.]